MSEAQTHEAFRFQKSDIPSSGELNLFGGFASLGKVLELVNLLGGIQKVLPAVQDIFAALSAWTKIADPWNTAPGLKARLTIIVSVGETISKLSPTTVDDQFIAFAKQLVGNDDALAVVVALIDAWLKRSGSSGGSSAGKPDSPFDFIKALKEIVPGL